MTNRRSKPSRYPRFIESRIEADTAMGRKSREKRERREQGSGPIAGAAKGASRAQLLALLEAASVSPTAAHRIPSLALVFDNVLRHARPGPRQVVPALLPTLVTAAHEVDPRLGSQEDWRPYDVRSRVLVPWLGGLHRLVPGSLERPVATVDFLGLLSSSIDRVLIENEGYGLRDVVELILRRIDHVASSLSPTWSSDETAVVGDPPRVSDREFAVAQSLRPLLDEVARCSAPERALLALQRHAVPLKRLSCDPLDPVSSFGSAIAVTVGPEQYVPIPAGVLVESLDAVGATLARRARELDPNVDERWAHAVAGRVGHALAGSGHSTAGPLRTPQGDTIHSASMYSRRQVLLIDVVTALDQDSLQASLEASSDCLDGVAAGTELASPHGSVRIEPDAEVAKLQVVAAPKDGGGALFSKEHVIATLPDLLWCARTCAREPVDLWHFVRDLADPKGVGRTFMWDMIDAWEVWRHNGKTFYRGGMPLTMLMFSPHAAEAEWQAAADTAPAEEALHKLGLPPLAAWPMVDDLAEVEYVGDLTQDRVFRLVPGKVPVAIASTDPSSTCGSGTIWSFADGVAWKLEHAHTAFIEAAEASGVKALRVGFSQGKDEDVGDQPIWIASLGDRTIVLGWDPGLQDALFDDSLSIESLAGRLVAERFTAGAARDAFIAAWDAAPPGIRVDGVAVEQRARDLPEPIEPHAAQRSAAQQRLGEHLLDSGVEPGSYEGSRATELESTFVYPWLVEELHRSLDGYDSRRLVDMAMNELERANFKRWSYNQRLAWQRGFPVHADPDEDDWQDRREGITTRVRCISLILEEVLARPSEGHSSPDRALWQEALAIAELCLESGMRSESVHLDLSRTSVTVTDSFEVNVDWSNEPIDVDLRGYWKLRGVATLPEAVPIGASDAHEPDAEPEEPKPLLDLMPELDGIDSALKDTVGFGLDALTGVLNVARQWEVTDAAPVGATTRSDFVEEATELAVGATADEYEHALDWLTLRGTDLAADAREHWETERRAVRVTTRPFVECADSLYVLPWSAEMTLKIVANYLSDGRLPWPGRSLPDKVTQALNRYRQRRNRQLELDCVDALGSGQLVVRGGIKPEKASKFGIGQLSGEIDAVCVDPLRSRIWVIEAKDPYTPFSPRQVRRLIQDFHQVGGYLDKLAAKVVDIERNASALASALDVVEPDRSWEVIELVVTRHPDPAAFAVSARAPFCTLDDLLSVVDQDAAPRLGHVPRTEAQE
jgi:hypothetical protein